ncbi:MAG: hypothetical protein JWQ70_2848 [Aeromicrobium sp.]|jgi:uncharacterized protein (TIGR03083 family)|nr:hypothetical protein [Aeromicrobium sp.]
MDHLLELGTAMTRFTELTSKATGDEEVPGCPGWDVRDLATHLGTIHRWAAAIVLSGQRVKMPQPVVTEPLVDWYAGSAGALLAALQAVSPDEPVPNFTHLNERASFFMRRQMHEATVHVVDAAQALGLEESEWQVLPEVAADGVDEVLQVFFPRMTAQGRRPDVRCRIRLVASDTGDEWVIAPGSGDLTPPLQLHRSYHSDASVRGTAADLYLALWHRVSRFRLEFEGTDATALFDGPTTP